jgi:D-alanyl-D-alanine carboxypeptidase (penicillin-binding protein 5/6)
MPSNSENPDGYPIFNRNMLIKNDSKNPYYYEFAKGIKTGSLDEYFIKNSNGEWEKTDGNTANLISFASRGGFNYLIVSFGADYYFGPYEDEYGNELKSNHYAYLDHELLYKWAFSSIDYLPVLSKNEPIHSVKVLEGQDVSEITLYPQMDEDCWTVIPKSLDIKSAIQYKIDVTEEEVVAPVAAGTVLGSVELLLANKTLGKWPLVTVENVTRSQSAEIQDKIGSVLDQWWFKPLIVVLALLIIALIVLNFMNHNREKSKKKNPNRRIRR